MKMYSVKETAEILGMNPETIRRLVREGALNAAVRNCGRGGHKFTESEIERFKSFRGERKRCIYNVEDEPSDIERFKQEVYELLAEVVTIEAKLTSILNELERG